VIIWAFTGGVTITNAQLATVQIERHRFHGDWNYTIRPVTGMPDKPVIV